MHNFRASIGMSVHHFKLDNERIPLLPVLYVQLGGKERQSVIAVKAFL